MFVGISVGETVAAEVPWFEQFPKFKPSNIKIEWAAVTNGVIAAPYVCKVVPQTFSGATISNLIALGPFPEDSIKRDSKISVSNKENKRNLFINPETGWIHYWDDKASVVKGPVVGVPTSNESERLALGLFDRLGFQRSELAKKRDGTNYLAFEDESTLTRFDKELGKETTVTCDRGTYFLRQVDGIPFAGIGNGGGFHVRFGNNAVIAEIEIIWRKLERYKQLRNPNREEINRWIQEGKVRMTRGTAIDSTGGPLDSTAINRLTVTNMIPLYTSAGGNEKQDFAYPFLKLSTLAKLNGTDSFLVLYCPIISDDLPQKN